MKLNRLIDKLTPQQTALLNWNQSIANGESEVTPSRDYAKNQRTFYYSTSIAFMSAAYQIDQLQTFSQAMVLRELDEKMAALTAHNYRLRAEGWALFCEEIGLDPALANQGFNAAETLDMADNLISCFEFELHELGELFAEHAPDAAENGFATAETWRDRFLDEYRDLANDAVPIK